MLHYLIPLIAFGLANAEKYFQIEDIPIENFGFDNEDLQSDAMDIELMPRFQRSFPTSDEDPKDFFFSRPFYEDSDFDASRDIPKPGGFSRYDEQTHGTTDKRKKREALQSTTVKLDGKGMKSIVRTLGKPLELRVIDPESVTESSSEGVTYTPTTDGGITETSNFLINDFIRFKRSTSAERADDVTRIKDLMKKIDEERKSKANSSEVNPKTMVEEVPTPYTEKLVMEPLGEDKEGMRDARGVTKEQWVKQEYPVRRNDLDDGPSSSGENVRAPRVHFVTQGMSESAPRPEYNRYDREGRSRNLNRELSYNLARDSYRDMDYYQPRYTRNYAPPAYSGFRQDRYLDDRDLRDPWDDNRSRSRYFEYPERNYNSNNNYNSYSGKKGRQRRIIYYASLPEVNRDPPSSDLRNRYDYRERDRYEDRFFRPNPDYQLRRPYDKARYEENINRNPPNPLKVSTDVSVRDVKKNPERRVYSEVDRNRYPQNPPYQNERM